MNMQEIGGRLKRLIEKQEKKRFFYTGTFCAVNWNELERILLIRKSQNKTL